MHRVNHSFINKKIKKTAIAILTVIIVTVMASPFSLSEALAENVHTYELSFNGKINQAGTCINMLGENMEFKLFRDGEHVNDTTGYTITIGDKTGKEIKCKVGKAKLDNEGSLWLTTDDDAFFETSVKMYLNTSEGEKIEFGWCKHYGPGFKSDITLERGTDVVPVNAGFGGSSTARMIVKYKGKPVESFEYMASGKSLGDISAQGSLLICEPHVEGDQNITIKVGSHQAVFRWHVANLKSNQNSEDAGGYVEGNSASGLKIGFDRYIVEPGANFGADCDIKITVLYEGKPTSDFTYKTGEKKIGSIRINPDDKSQLLLSPDANGDESIFITCNGEIEVFVWHTEHVERFRKEENQNNSDKSEADKTTDINSAQKDKTDEKTGKDAKDENSQAVSDSQNGGGNTKQPEETENPVSDAVKDNLDAINEQNTVDTQDNAEIDNNDEAADAPGEPAIATELDESEPVSSGTEDDIEENVPSSRMSGNSDLIDSSAEDESKGFLGDAVRVFSSFVEWLKMLIEKLIF